LVLYSRNLNDKVLHKKKKEKGRKGKERNMSFAEIALSGAENGGQTRILPLKFIVNTISTNIVSNIFV